MSTESPDEAIIEADSPASEESEPELMRYLRSCLRFSLPVGKGQREKSKQAIEMISAFVIEQLGEELHSIDIQGINAHEQRQLLRRGIKMATDEFGSEYRNDKITADQGGDVFFLLLRRLIDVYLSPVLAEKDGEHVSTSSRTDIEHVRFVVQDCIESEREALYWVECARMDVSDAIRPDRNETLSLDQRRAVFAHANVNLDNALHSLNGRKNQGITQRIEDVRAFAKEVLGIDDK